MNALPAVYLIVGPTGIGKTEVSLLVAAGIHAEIISADSRQIYRKMDIATAKPSIEERSAVPHHFIDVADPGEVYDAGRFGREARLRILELIKRGKNALVVGGSGLYIRSLIDGFFGGSERDTEVRERIRCEIRELGLGKVYQILSEIDPVTAERLHPNDARRIERALEVFRVTGRPLSELHLHQNREPWCRPFFAGLKTERDSLYDRINRRVDRMIQAGVIGETQRLLAEGYSPGLVSMEGLGYREIIRYLSHETGRDAMLNLFKQHSRNYAKRQMTWFGKDERIRWFETGPDKTKEALASEIISYITSASLQ